MDSYSGAAECELIFKNRFMELKKQLEYKNNWLTYEYVKTLEKNLSVLLESVSEKTFWYVFPKILGIDAKINLLESLINVRSDFHLPESEIIQLVENDYRKINKESFNFEEEVTKSVIFCVE